jgi:hypothetical protein
MIVLSQSILGLMRSGLGRWKQIIFTHNLLRSHFITCQLLILLFSHVLKSRISGAEEGIKLAIRLCFLSE